MKAYYCVGGPLDGQVRAAADNVTSFRVAEWPDASALELDTVTPATPTNVRTTTYQLQEREDGLAWVYQA